MSQKENMVNGLIGTFKSKGLEIVYAESEGYPKPDPIIGKRPDVIAWDSDKELYHIGTVTDSSEFKPEKWDNKLGTLSNLMMSQGKSATKRIPFYLGVPQKTSEKIIKILDQNQISRDNVQTLELGEKND